MLANDVVDLRPRISASRARCRGSSTGSLLGGAALLLIGIGLGILLAGQRAAPQGAYEAPVVPGRARTRAPGRPSIAPRPRDGGGSPAGHPSERPAASASRGVVVNDATASSAMAAETPGGSPTDADARAPFAWPGGRTGVLLVGPGGAEAAADLGRVLGAAPGSAERRPVFDATDRTDLGEGEIPTLLVEAEPGSIRVRRAAPPRREDDPISDGTPAASLVGDVLTDVRLPVGPRSGPALAALAWLVAGEPASARAALASEAPPASPRPGGERILLAYAALLERRLSEVHEVLSGIASDPAVGAVARFLTGAALLADGNPREALRDLAAALAAKPELWPARLLVGVANDRLALPEAARDAYAEVIRVVPGRPEAVVGFAPHLAATDLPAAIALEERLVAERPGLVPAWWQLAWLRRKGETSEDRRLEVDALEHLVRLSDGDADAWGALGSARTRWARAGGGIDAFRGAAEAFARQTDLAPTDGLAWFNRAATLHQIALELPLSGDATLLVSRISEANAAYAKALARGLSRSDAARVHFNLGLLVDAIPRSSSPDAEAASLSRRASDAYAAAIAADPGYVDAALALLASHVGARDVAAARSDLAAMPPGADPRERAVLEAALAQVQGDVTGAKRLLAGGGRVVVVGTEALPTLARELLLLGYRRLVDSLLRSGSNDAGRLALRARARAGLGDVAGARADLDALGALDAAKAADLRRDDPDVRRALGPPKG